MNTANFFTELKRRNVYKVAVAYAIVGWLVVQIATQVFPFLEIPNWVVRSVIVLVAIGFPVALIIAWAFELTPGGIKRMEGVGPSVAGTSKGRTWIYVAVIGAALSIVLFFIGRYTGQHSASGSGTELPAKSIAVLPFENLSDEKGNAYFAEGIQEEILTRLSRIADLKVISRTSTQKYKSAPDDLREIAQKLGVANILEGSVQKSNDQVRVTVQLINALSDSHLWAETFDRKLVDVFGVESDIAQRIAGSLEARLTGREKEAIAFVGTKNPQAYDALLHAIALENSSSNADLARLIEFCRRAVELDPNYAEAWATLAIAEGWQFDSPWQGEELKESARVAAETALRLAPDSAKAHRAMGYYYRYFRKDMKAALAELELARDRAPNDGDLLYDLGRLQRAQGKIDESIASMKKAADLDPLNGGVLTGLAWTYEGLRQFDEAHAIQDRALAIAPDDPDRLAAKALIYQAQGDLDGAWKVIGPHRMPPLTEWAFTIYYAQFYLWRDYGTLIALLNGLDRNSKNVPPLLVAGTDAALVNLYLLNGQRDLAIPCAQRAEREMRDLRGQKFIQPELSGLYIECAARFENRDEVEREIEFLFAETRQDQWIFPTSEYSAAVGYVLLGELDKALPLLQDSLEKPTGITAAWLKLRPEWDSVRNDPRFQKLANSKP